MSVEGRASVRACRSENVFVGNQVVIGDHCKVQNNVSVYDSVTLEEGVFCGPSMVFTNVYNPRSLIERKSEYRPTTWCAGAPALGANCTIVCGVTIGEFAFIGAGAVVNQDVPAYALMVGVPARQVGWMSEFGEQLDLPLQGEGEVPLPAKRCVLPLAGSFRLQGDALMVFRDVNLCRSILGRVFSKVSWRAPVVFSLTPELESV